MYVKTYSNNNNNNNNDNNNNDNNNSHDNDNRKFPLSIILRGVVSEFSFPVQQPRQHHRVHTNSSLLTTARHLLSGASLGKDGTKETARKNKSTLTYL
ncbi:hypothetical protein E2C01_069708 [Portunus trituberculatus]|uniref:Uncharacterized protein n=1 Tax=Portunus trituberculatus TaxID=210409 RepID=A0A5B7HV98_PORTR|nr:hypothetical protein [Portunus trituberculatus]